MGIVEKLLQRGANILKAEMVCVRTISTFHFIFTSIQKCQHWNFQNGSDPLYWAAQKVALPAVEKLLQFEGFATVSNVLFEMGTNIDGFLRNLPLLKVFDV